MITVSLHFKIALAMHYVLMMAPVFTVLVQKVIPSLQMGQHALVFSFIIIIIIIISLVPSIYYLLLI
jgi:hypothetical protein